MKKFKFSFIIFFILVNINTSLWADELEISSKKFCEKAITCYENDFPKDELKSEAVRSSFHYHVCLSLTGSVEKIAKYCPELKVEAIECIDSATKKLCENIKKNQMKPNLPPISECKSFTKGRAATILKKRDCRSLKD